MSKLTMEIVKSDNAAGKLDIGRGECVFGGDMSNPTWEKYIDNWQEHVHPHLELIKNWILSHDIIPTGDEFCNGNYFKFSDGKKIGFSWRAWGDICQAAVGRREGYMKYYMR